MQWYEYKTYVNSVTVTTTDCLLSKIYLQTDVSELTYRCWRSWRSGCWRNDRKPIKALTFGQRWVRSSSFSAVCLSSITWVHENSGSCPRCSEMAGHLSRRRLCRSQSWTIWTVTRRSHLKSRKDQRSAQRPPLQYANRGRLGIIWGAADRERKLYEFWPIGPDENTKRRLRTNMKIRFLGTGDQIASRLFSWCNPNIVPLNPPGIPGFRTVHPIAENSRLGVKGNGFK